jgi:hypothetical protein
VVGALEVSGAPSDGALVTVVEVLKVSAVVEASFLAVEATVPAEPLHAAARRANVASNT